eukprot:1137124-Pelagomonas_calceolata.AAC.3
MTTKCNAQQHCEDGMAVCGLASQSWVLCKACVYDQLQRSFGPITLHELTLWIQLVCRGMGNSERRAWCPSHLVIAAGQVSGMDTRVVLKKEMGTSRAQQPELHDSASHVCQVPSFIDRVDF